MGGRHDSARLPVPASPLSPLTLSLAWAPGSHPALRALLSSVHARRPGSRASRAVNQSAADTASGAAPAANAWRGGVGLGLGVGPLEPGGTPLSHVALPKHSTHAPPPPTTPPPPPLLTRVVRAYEHVAQDPQRAQRGGHIQAHEPRDALLLTHRTKLVCVGWGGGGGGCVGGGGVGEGEWGSGCERARPPPATTNLHPPTPQTHTHNHKP